MDKLWKNVDPIDYVRISAGHLAQLEGAIYAHFGPKNLCFFKVILQGFCDFLGAWYLCYLIVLRM